ncbi:GPI-anchored surface protein, putative [Bodo saltans]|uniref:GPI-anchored surface protein, putative n=1 Tax=Bodo saltans TaxID=75058 RepID=A0A0S4JK15_BODSA|nr:GPI-anchored surface protein, putative [Bodo saltans]|eukprot:CUG89340.1 GPI-anchored surface protein, putative [Bodo saltans]
MSLAMLLVVLSCCPGAEASHDVPVMVSTVSRSTFLAPNADDITVDGNGNVLYVARFNNAVYRLADGGSLLLAGSGIYDPYGSSDTTGTTDGVGPAAKFFNPNGITCDTTNNIAYISDQGNYRIRTLVLATNTVTTLAGSTSGHADGVGSAAQFYYPQGIVYHSSGVLYVTELDSTGYIRKIAVSASVTSVTSIAPYNNGWYLCINNAGTHLYVTTLYQVLQVDVSTGASVALAGSVGDSSYADGIGPDARFSTLQGIALNSDESALIIADQNNQRIRRLEIATKNVKTLAGTGESGFSDGPGATATFLNRYGMKWHCNATMSVCGVLVADLDNRAVRFVAVEAMPTPTAALSDEGSVTPSVSHDASASYSSTLAMSRTNSGSHSSVASHSATNIVSMTTCTSLSSSATVTFSKLISSSTSITMNASWSRSATTEASASDTMGATLSLATVGASASITPTALTSVSNTRSKATRSHSATRRTASSSSSTYCALVAADGAASLAAESSGCLGSQSGQMSVTDRDRSIFYPHFVPKTYVGNEKIAFFLPQISRLQKRAPFSSFLGQKVAQAPPWRPSALRGTCKCVWRPNFCIRVLVLVETTSIFRIVAQPVFAVFTSSPISQKVLSCVCMLLLVGECC